MTTELVTTSQIFRAPVVPQDEKRRPLEGPEIAVVRYLGIHCGVGGQVILPRHLQKGTASASRLGLVSMWFKHELGVGLTRPFYGLTDRGRQLAAALLRPRPKPQRHRAAANPRSK